MNRILLLFLLCSCGLFAQTPVIDSLKTVLQTAPTQEEKAHLELSLARQYERVDLATGKSYALSALKFTGNDSLSAEVHNQLGRFYFFTSVLDSAEFHFDKTRSLMANMGDSSRMAVVSISLGAIQLRKGDYKATVNTLTQAAQYFENQGDELNAAKCYSNIASAFAELENYPKAIEYSEKSLDIFNRLEQVQFQLITLPNLATQYFKLGDTAKAIAYNGDAERLAKNLGDNRSLSIIYNNLGSLYLKKDPAKAKEYLTETIRLKETMNLLDGIEVAKSNLGYLMLEEGNYRGAIANLEVAKRKIQGKQRVLLLEHLAAAYEGVGSMDLALAHARAAKITNDSIMDSENQKAIVEIQTQYETEKKENQILALTNENLQVDFKRKQNRNYLFAVLGALVLTLILGYIGYKSNRRKRVIAQQQLTIDRQRFEQQIKQQELNGIDAIVDAQEKERAKMAADLHDHLGSKIAALKLLVESQSAESDSKSFKEKLTGMMDDTYQAVRNMSRNKNFGAYINKGLIPSTQYIANQISQTEALQITVNAVGITQRVENSKEIQLFRIIQELLTNVIKHAKASEVTVQFTEDEDELIIMVEDNGIGFDPEKNYDGMGLNNIRQRVSRTGGQLNIDSAPGNGTTVIINVPM